MPSVFQASPRAHRDRDDVIALATGSRTQAPSTPQATRPIARSTFTTPPPPLQKSIAAIAPPSQTRDTASRSFTELPLTFLPLQTFTMPKEKTTKRATKGRGEKKKKGESPLSSYRAVASTNPSSQIPMPPREVSLPTCSSPTSSARTSTRRTPASASVSA